MAASAIKQDIETVYALADQGMGLPALMEAILAVLARHEDALSDITHSYRLQATDTGYETAFALTQGKLSLLNTQPTDVTVTGKADDLQLVFQRKLSPLTALLRGKIKLTGSKAALMKLAAFL